MSGKKAPLQPTHQQSELATTPTATPTADNQQLEQYIFSDSQPSPSPKTTTSGFCSFIENRLKMQPTSNVDDLETVDLTTESLPAVDTPDACDKAALRYSAEILLTFN